MSNRHRDPMAGAPRLKNPSNPPLEEVVAHLNRNTDRIQSWRANSVRIRADRFSLSGTIAVEKGRHLHLVVNSIRGNEVDLGSNDERFWVWSREMEPSFVTCKHENMEAARQQLGIPFEPDWLMQALGVAPLPTTGVTMEADPVNEQARLVEQVVSAHGQPLRRVVLVDLKRGIVLEHSLYAYNGGRIALAKLSDHRLDKSTGVVLPHRVTLDWPQSKMSMTMSLGDVQINPTSIPSQVWEMPEVRNCEIVHLDSNVRRGNIATAIRPESPVHLGTIETVRSHDDHNFLRDDADAARVEDSTGRARLSSAVNETARSNDEDDDWAK